MRTHVNRITIGLFLLAFTGCFWHGTQGVKACKYSFHKLDFIGVDGAASHWKLTVGVANPNAKPVTLTRLRYALVHEADTMLTGANPQEHEVPPGDSLISETTLDIPNTLWQRLPPGIWSQTDAAFTIVGDAYVHTWMGDIVVNQAIKQTVHVDMTKQVARMKEMLLQKLFGGGWPGRHLEDGGIVGPDTSAPRAPVRPGAGDDPL